MTNKVTGAPAVISASTVCGTAVVNPSGEDLGKVEEVMLDVGDSRIAYVVLSFGGLFGIGSKLFAIPWESLRYDHGEERYVLDVDKERLKDAPSFDKDNWPDTADPKWRSSVYKHYGATPYWQ